MSDKERASNVIIYALGVIEDLKRDGLISGGQYQLGEGGRLKYQELLDSGFAPTENEMTQAMNALTQLR